MTSLTKSSIFVSERDFHQTNLSSNNFAGPIPAGYAFEARATAEATHHIPEKVDFAETNVMKLYRDMLQFLMPNV